MAVSTADTLRAELVRWLAQCAWCDEHPDDPRTPERSETLGAAVLAWSERCEAAGLRLADLEDGR